MNEIIKKITKDFKQSTYINRIIYINIITYIIYTILRTFNILDQEDIRIYLGLPDTIQMVIKRPWTLISYMFIHVKITHIIFNLFALSYIGKISMSFFNNKQIIYIYLFGGVFGGLSYTLISTIDPILQQGSLIGASSSILAILIATSIYKPNYIIQIPIISRSIKLKYLAFFIFCIFLIFIRDEETHNYTKNAGGYIAHIGGSIYGIIYIISIKNKLHPLSIIYYLLRRFNMLDNNKLRRHHLGEDHLFRDRRERKKEIINKILEKISNSGYDSLSEKEKKILFKESQK